jgi:hypothetical protein
VALAGGLLAALLGGYWYVFEFRPWEAHYRLRPTSWWANEVPGWLDASDYHSARLPDYEARLSQWEKWQLQLGLFSRKRHRERFQLLLGDPAAVPVLVELLRCPDPVARERAADGLGCCGGDARESSHALVAALRDGDRRVRGAARGALKRIDPDALAAYDREHPQEKRP